MRSSIFGTKFNKPRITLFLFATSAIMPNIQTGSYSDGWTPARSTIELPFYKTPIRNVIPGSIWPRNKKYELILVKIKAG